jgi:hypothetical protein
MPVESFRRWSKKIIADPGGSGGIIPILVIDEIWFIDPKSFGHGFRWTFDNSDAANPTVTVTRITHVRHLAGADGSSKLDIEVIDFFTDRDPKSFAQGKTYGFAIADDGSSNSANRKTHVQRVLGGANNDDPSIWLDSELIDVWRTNDPKSFGQDTDFILKHPDGWPDPSKVTSG